MTDAIIIAPGLYVMRIGRPQWIEENEEDAPDCWWDVTGKLEWLSSGSYVGLLKDHPYDIIRRATPEEAAAFCGLALPAQEGPA